MSKLIDSTRLSISTMGGSELKAVASNEGMQEMFKQKQALIMEMNTAKRQAADAAAIPYLEAIAELDQMYAMMLTLMGDNKER